MKTRAERLLIPLGWGGYFIYLVILAKTKTFGLMDKGMSIGEGWAINLLPVGLGLIVSIIFITKTWEFLENRYPYWRNRG